MLIRDALLTDAPAMGRLHVAAWRAAYVESMGAAFLASLDPLEREARWRDLISQAGDGGATGPVVHELRYRRAL